MSNRAKWDNKYRTAACDTAMCPPDFLISHADEVLVMLPVRPRVLDLAAGTGRNSIYLAKSGCRVLAVDYAREGLRHCVLQAIREQVDVRAIAVDLHTFLFPVCGYDLVINFFFLQREFFPAMVNALKPGGILMFETYTTRYQAVHRERSMRREYLLEPEELRYAFPGLTPLFYEETATTARLIAQKL